MDDKERARNLADKLQDCVDVVRGDGGIERMIMDDRGLGLLAAAFAEVKSDTLSDAENAAFEALTRHGFTGARYCVIAAIHGLIDDPDTSGTSSSIDTTGAAYIVDADGVNRVNTEPAAPDPTKALAKLFATLWNERWNQSDEERTAWHYRGIEVGLLDGSEVENERISLSVLGRAALRLAENGG